jgi:hypothetical protein
LRASDRSQFQQYAGCRGGSPVPLSKKLFAEFLG